jgi:hypothetical protein
MRPPKGTMDLYKLSYHDPMAMTVTIGARSGGEDLWHLCWH